jgi:hypothetical protein
MALFLLEKLARAVALCGPKPGFFFKPPLSARPAMEAVDAQGRVRRRLRLEASMSLPPAKAAIRLPAMSFDGRFTSSSPPIARKSLGVPPEFAVNRLAKPSNL